MELKLKLETLRIKLNSTRIKFKLKLTFLRK